MRTDFQPQADTTCSEKTSKQQHSQGGTAFSGSKPTFRRGLGMTPDHYRYKSSLKLSAGFTQFFYLKY